MATVFSRIGDRILDKLVPKASATAAEWFVHCYCRERSDFRKICMNAGGRTRCGACYAFRIC